MIKYVYILSFVAVIFLMYHSYNYGRASVIDKLSSDRIEVLKDGKKIDSSVFAADDNSLICMLANCDN